MALKAVTSARISKSLRRFVAFLKYRALGPHALTKTELKDLVSSGVVHPNQGSQLAVARSYLTSHAELALTAPKAARAGSIEFLERMFARYADKTAEDLTADLLAKLEAGLMPFTDRREGAAVYGLLTDRAQAGKYLGQALNGVVDQWKNRWKLIVDTELGRAANYGALDAIVHNNRDKSPEDIVVYKVGPSPVCKECSRFWFTSDGVTPKLYRLSELVGGGSNIGRKRAEWRPTVDSTHPGCSHFVMNQLKPGYGLRGAAAVYVSKDHDALAAQRS